MSTCQTFAASNVLLLCTLIYYAFGAILHSCVLLQCVDQLSRGEKYTCWQPRIGEQIKVYVLYKSLPLGVWWEKLCSGHCLTTKGSWQKLEMGELVRGRERTFQLYIKCWPFMVVAVDTWLLGGNSKEQSGSLWKQKAILDNVVNDASWKNED